VENLSIAFAMNNGYNVESWFLCYIKAAQVMIGALAYFPLLTAVNCCPGFTEGLAESRFNLNKYNGSFFFGDDIDFKSV
jgi:hypothetical protein